MLKQGVEAWNTWRRDHPDVEPDLHEANLYGAQLKGINLTKADLQKANLTGASLQKANLEAAKLNKAELYRANLTRANLQKAKLREVKLGGATLREANLQRVYLTGAYLKGANLKKADLRRANLKEVSLKGAKLQQANLNGATLEQADLPHADLTEATLVGANLEGAVLMRTTLQKADLTGCRVYGVAAWDLVLDETIQEALIISPEGEPTITVDDIEVAQFIYFMLSNEKIRRVIDSLTSKAVLILGRFKKPRKAILDALREALRDKYDLLPILFDFDIPDDRDVTETVTLLARMARFIIADLTEPSSIPKELEAIVPDLAIPVQPIIEGADRPYAMFKDYWKYTWVLDLHRYEGLGDLLGDLEEKVITPAQKKAEELAELKKAAWS